MWPDGTVRVEHLWKRFRTDRRRKLLRDEIDRLVRTMRTRGRGERHRWVLKDISLHMDPGESVGLIGTNGSGKSTLLKLITRVMYPYAGSVTACGRVGALIEVRAGIHPDLSGRENVFLYGSLLGLSRSEVAKRFDQIVDFAEVPDAIDRQVKFYSSGMQMRIGFAVAAFLEPDILLVDEVLAVGDAAFQQKCMQRMREVLADGTTLVFVSHDLAAVEATCARGLWLESGEVRSDGPIRSVLNDYRESIEQMAESELETDGDVRLVKTEVAGAEGEPPRTSESLHVRVVVNLVHRSPANVFMGISEGPAAPIFVVRRDLQLPAGESEIRCAIANLPLPRGRYFLWVGIFDKKHDLIPWHPAARFDVSGPDLQDAPRAIARLAPVHVDTAWEIAPL